VPKHLAHRAFESAQTGSNVKDAQRGRPEALSFSGPAAKQVLAASRRLGRQSKAANSSEFQQRCFAGAVQMLMGALVTFLVVILILYLINLLPLDRRAREIARIVVIILGVISLLKYIAVF
jgi:hypothetical protein